MAVLSFLLSLCLQSCTEPQQSVHTDLIQENSAFKRSCFHTILLLCGVEQR